ncbi:hypothetical protein H072_7727 [Dactylellina haptotyla CBS 200.50]|uniref:F-box domain-containing protein n=1 Tax=Dactylellina haptotyla (strain CBS 200.50) TaxID=1284197 RepID=S8ABL6_DACHA|nr:hypothetical protein H072_7727 [Dactylellina haptotyla CBS 200.50]
MSKTAELLDPDRSRDFAITSLPIELQIQILSHLAFVHQLPAANTCKLWRHIIRTTPSIKKRRYIPLCHEGSQYIWYIHSLVDLTYPSRIQTTVPWWGGDNARWNINSISYPFLDEPLLLPKTLRPKEDPKTKCSPTLWIHLVAHRQQQECQQLNGGYNLMGSPVNATESGQRRFTMTYTGTGLTVRDLARFIIDAGGVPPVEAPPIVPDFDMEAEVEVNVSEVLGDEFLWLHIYGTERLWTISP